MFSALLITFREGLEAALIIAIVVAFLWRSGEGRLVRYAWAGAGAAILLSLAAGGALFYFAGELEEEAAEFFEVVGTLAAVAVLTYMIIWMRDHGAGIKGGLEGKARRAAGAATPLAITLLAFTAVGREGLETALFIFAGASSSSAVSTTIGAFAGFSLAVLAGVAIYRGSSKLDLRLFFSVTGVLLILFAAGILSYSVHGLGELGIIPSALDEPLWDTGRLLGHGDGLGAVLKASFGYYATPSLLQVAVYWTYLSTMLFVFFRPRRKRFAALVRQGS